MKKDAYEKTGKEILDCLPKRMERSNKGTYGKVLCVAGSVNMAGAAFYVPGLRIVPERGL